MEEVFEECVLKGGTGRYEFRTKTRSRMCFTKRGAVEEAAADDADPKREHTRPMSLFDIMPVAVGRLLPFRLRVLVRAW